MSKQKQKKSSVLTGYGKTAGMLVIAGAVVLGSVLPSLLRTAKAADVVVYKSETCGCCKKWVSHLEKNGFRVETHDKRNLRQIKAEMGVPNHLHSCHTAKVGDYIVEGHVPAKEILRLLTEKPQVKGLAVPGMPMGSPGMEGPRKDSYDILTFEESGKTSVFASR